MSGDVSGYATGYDTRVPYPRSFTPQVTPQTLRLVAALNGLAPPAEDGFAYCDLGCATGDTLTTVAAANPGARFVGVELSPEHVAKGRERAARGEVPNVTFVHADFEELASARLADELGIFDFIVAHGIWSWVSPQKRGAILAFVRAHLRPGGLFYVGYNALPGWADVAPLRRLMLEHTSPAAPPLDRARDAVALLQRLADSGAGYFASHPVARSMLALMSKAGLPYVVHEHLHADWEPLYFADVARSLAASGLDYVGGVPLHANVRELAIPPSLRKLAESVPSRAALEGLKDFATGDLFRGDVYVHGKPLRAVDETRYYFEGTSFGTLAQLAHVKREVKLEHYTLDYKAPHYEAILAVLAVRPSTAMELALRPELAQFGQLRIGDCLQNLVLGGQVIPMRSSPPSEAAAPRSGVYRLTLPYNRLVLDEALAGEGPLVFASPATRGGVHISILEALSVHLVTDASLAPERYADAVRAYAASRPMPLAVGERRIKDADELVKVMARELERFRASSLPKLVEAAVLEPA